MTSNRKSWSRNPLVILFLTYDLSFKIISGQTYTNHALSPLLLLVEIQYVLLAHWKSCSMNPPAILVFTYDLSFKVICDLKKSYFFKSCNIASDMLPNNVTHSFSLSQLPGEYTARIFLVLAHSRLRISVLAASG